MENFDNIPLAEVSFVAFDVETTGLSPTRDRMVELAGLRFTLDGQERGTFHSMIKTDTAMNPAALNVHHITPDLLENAPGELDVVGRFCEFIQPNDYLVAHNATFDIGFMLFALRRCGLPLLPNIFLDSLTLARLRKPNLASYKLESLAEYFQYGTKEFHRAAEDCRALAHIFQQTVRSSPPMHNLTKVVRLSRGFTFHDFLLEGETLSSTADQLRSLARQAQAADIYYTRKDQPPAWHTIIPEYLFRDQVNLYVLAYCPKEGFAKSYRVDRISDLRVSSTTT